MALLHTQFRSDALQIAVSVDVILPQEACLKGRKPPVLYLLHGLSDDHSIWLRRTSIERYAEALGLAVVMPAVNRSFYADMAYGAKYWTFVSEELPRVMHGFFPLSDKRADTFVAGLSMGGYGAAVTICCIWRTRWLGVKGSPSCFSAVVVKIFSSRKIPPFASTRRNSAWTCTTRKGRVRMSGGIGTRISSGCWHGCLCAGESERCRAGRCRALLSLHRS